MSMQESCNRWKNCIDHQTIGPTGSHGVTREMSPGCLLEGLSETDHYRHSRPDAAAGR